MGFFLGCGLVCGQLGVKVGGRSQFRRICAPLLFASVELPDPNEKPTDERVSAFEPVWESLTLNIDLVSCLLTGEAEPDPEDADVGQVISDDVLSRLAKIEEDVSEISRSPKARAQLLEGKTAGIFTQLLTAIPDCQQISTIDEPLQPEELSLDEKQLEYFPESFLFRAAIPSQLTTTVALHRLIDEVASVGFRSQLIADLLGGAFNQKQVELRHEEISSEQVEKAIACLPLSLSGSQRAAINNAWCSKLSYVQGPPGTGKSHTIVAMMLSALVMKRRVLMVSHKPAAVAIVRDKLNKLLCVSDGIAVMDASPLANNRQRVRGFLRKIISASQGKAGSGAASQLKKTLVLAESDLSRVTGRLANELAEFQKSLDRERSFVQMHESFLQARLAVTEAYGVPEQSLRHLPPPLNSFTWQNAMERADSAISRLDGEGVRRVDLLFLKRFFAMAAKQLPIQTQNLAPSRTTLSYIKALVDLCARYDEIRQRLQFVVSGDVGKLRKSIDSWESKAANYRLQYCRSVYDAGVALNLQDPDVRNAVTDFEKLLHWSQPAMVDRKMREIEVEKVTQTLPLWVGEMRHLGHFLPFQDGLFDLVIVDEASQVNIAEIMPAIARGNRVCVVGDEKQLGLESVGFAFIAKKFEELAWDRHQDGNQSLKDAEDAALRVTKNSILDFVAHQARPFHIPRSMLNEHFRSVPRLARFTSREFYKEDGGADGGLILMRENSTTTARECFKFIEVSDGKRTGKVVPQEVKKTLQLVKSLVRNNGFVSTKELAPLCLSEDSPPSIGILSFLTDQRNVIEESLRDELTSDEWINHDLMIGTTEEFQGNERQIMILTMGIDADTKYARGFYENLRRFNVATSRAIDFTYLIASAIPSNADLLKRYLKHFDVRWMPATLLDMVPKVTEVQQLHHWGYDAKKRESEFERKVDEYLQKFIETVGLRAKLSLFNQVTACGQKRLDFVLSNDSNGRCCAVEVDGRDHFIADGRQYSQAHLERVDILKRANWEIVHLPYYKWYSGGWLCDQNDRNFQSYVSDLYRDLETALWIQ